ncbi:hypothetical protein Asp14428_46040 [Actinoplanes sp. NBRC 14428]|nr:hypothetical protein Asp14428_46040 [Actinoplanes sp. NBRC 14428]
MSYAVQHPAAAAGPAPAATPRRPVPVAFASVLLLVMAVVGLGYAVATLAVAPGTVDRFRQAAGDRPDVDGYVTVVWISAAVGAVLAVLLFALYVVLALGLRRGSNGVRIATLVVCVLGLLAGGAATLTMVAQEGWNSLPGSVGAALSDAYPGPWIGLNVGLSVAQMIGYAVVALLLLTAPRAFFGRATEQGRSATSGQAPPPGYAPPRATRLRRATRPRPAMGLRRAMGLRPVTELLRATVRPAPTRPPSTARPARTGRLRVATRPSRCTEPPTRLPPP